MRLVIFLSGAAILLIGIAGLAGIIPMSLLNTVSFSQPNVSCGSNGACSVTFSITNNNATSNFAVYMQVTNAAYQKVYQQTIQMQYSISQFTVPAIPLTANGASTFPPGAYIFSIFAVSNQQVVLSGMTSQAFNVGGNYVLTIDPYNSATGSLSVSPSCAINPSMQSVCSLAVGTPVAVSYTPSSGYLFGQWCYWYSGSTLPPSDGCTLNGTFGQKSGQFTSQTNPLQFTMTGNYELIYSVSQSSPALNIQYFTVTPIVSITGGCSYGDTVCKRGTVSPVDTPKIYSLASASYGQTSQIFTATPSANYTFANFQVNGQNFTQNPLTLAYSDLQPLQSSGQINFQLYAYFKAKLFYPLGIGAYAGITTTPTAKNTNYVYPAGASVTVSLANVSPNLCFTGWLVDGNPAGSGNSITVTMNQMHTVFAQGIGKGPNGCSPAPPPGGGSFMPFVFLVVGGLVMALGVRRKH